MPTPLSWLNRTKPDRTRNELDSDEAIGDQHVSAIHSDTSSKDESLFLWTYEPLTREEAAPYVLVERKREPKRYQVQLREVNETGELRRTKNEQALDDSRSSTEASDTSDAIAEDHYMALQEEMERAVDTWQLENRIPKRSLLRDALLASSAGLAFPPEQQSLLLRASLYYQAGIRSAIRLQDDAELAAIVIGDAITRPENESPPQEILSLFAQAPNKSDLKKALIAELRAATSSTNPRTRMHAIEALWYLQDRSGDRLDGTSEDTSSDKLPRRHLFGIIAAVAVAIIVPAIVFRMNAMNALPRLPAGQYSIPISEMEQRLVIAPEIVVDVYEVTNLEYRQCVARGSCSPPQLAAAADIADYYVNPIYNEHPVVNVSHQQAESFCNKHGKRLPTQEEWMLAASAAPATGLFFNYPWGNVPDSQRANTVESAVQAPAAVGSFRPAGDSPIGATDMAGNVAEWTATLENDGAGAMVMGGSYRSDLEAATVYAGVLIPTNVVADWIGFRCISTK